MDYFKSGTTKDYTAWDQNCPKYVKGDPKLKRILKRKFRRIDKKSVDKLQKEE